MMKRITLASSLALSVAVAVLVIAIPPARAASSIVGTWQGNFAANGTPCSVQSIYQSNGTYSELLHCGSMMTRQSGTYVFHDGLLVRSVTDWDPRRQWVVGACVGCGYWETLAKPPGGSYRVNFNGANSMTLHDVNLGGVLTMHRAG
jgi:hypothetical protein